MCVSHIKTQFLIWLYICKYKSNSTINIIIISDTYININIYVFGGVCMSCIEHEVYYLLQEARLAFLKVEPKNIFTQ